MDRGPVMLSWQDVLASSVTSEGGYNVVIHEFAHKIDMRGGDADGCPPLPPGFAGKRTARESRAAWLAVLQPAYDDFPRENHHGRALRRRAAVARRLRRDIDQRILRGGLRGLLREPAELRPGLRRGAALFDEFFLSRQA
jgi:hypothetical protein